MGFIKKAWRGEQRLGVVFWGYYLGFSFLFLLVYGVLGLLLDVFPDIAKIAIAAMSLLMLIYFVWVVVSVWRCANNAKPVWHTLARLWIGLAAIGMIGIYAQNWIESYKHYQELAHAKSEQREGNGVWSQGLLNEAYMRSLTKDECMSRTIETLRSVCKSDGCIKTMGGIVGDCVMLASGDTIRFCADYDAKYTPSFCLQGSFDEKRCYLIKVGKKVLCEESGY